MILIDTSIWVDHLRRGEPHLAELLERGLASFHELVLGELACGHLANRRKVLSLLSNLPKCHAATHEEALFFIERHHLMGRGIGYVDVCLLAAAALGQRRLWTRDKRLAAVAEELRIAYRPDP